MTRKRSFRTMYVALLVSNMLEEGKVPDWLYALEIRHINFRTFLPSLGRT